MCLDAEISCKRIFLFDFLWPKGRARTSLEVAENEGMVGRLGLEPRTKALKERDSARLASADVVGDASGPRMAPF